MSAMITHERRTYDCRLFLVDKLGHYHCGACLDPADLGIQEVPEDPKDDTRCEFCGILLQEGPMFVNTGIATIEHPVCRIF